jgi:hypothetical protein
VPEFLADAEFTPKERTYATGPRGPRERSEDQKPYDEAFGHAVDHGFLHVQIAPEEADTVRKAVNRAARYHEKAVTEGQARPGKKKGTVVLSWQIRTPVPRKSRDASETELPETSE